MTTKFYDYVYINDAYQLTIMSYEEAYMIIIIGSFTFVCLSFPVVSPEAPFNNMG